MSFLRKHVFHVDVFRFRYTQNTYNVKIFFSLLWSIVPMYVLSCTICTIQECFICSLGLLTEFKTGKSLVFQAHKQETRELCIIGRDKISFHCLTRTSQVRNVLRLYRCNFGPEPNPQKEDGNRRQGKGHRVAVGLWGKMCSVPCHASCFASFYLEETVEFSRSIWTKQLNSTVSFKSTGTKQLARQGIEQIFPPKPTQ